MLDIPSISAVVAAVGVLVGVILTYQEIRSLVSTRKTDLVTSIYSSVSTREYLEAWEKFKDREITDLNEYKKEYGFVELNMVMTRFDQIEALLRRKLIDVELVQDLFGPTVFTVWEKLKPALENQKRRLGKPHVWRLPNTSTMKCRRESRDYNRHNNKPFITYENARKHTRDYIV